MSALLDSQDPACLRSMSPASARAKAWPCSPGSWSARVTMAHAHHLGSL